MPRTKECTARIKAAGPTDGLADGQFVAIVSVFGNVDSVGDVVVPGAFARTLAEWRAKGDPIPVIWSHDWDDPFAHVGIVLDARETPDGLEVTGQIEDVDTNPTAAQVYRLLKGRRVTQFSFAYDVREGAWVETEDDQGRYDGYYELRDLTLYEVGPCLVGANQATELLAAKASQLARGLKAGRVLAQAHIDRLSEAHSAIGDVLAAATAADAAKTTTAPESGHRPAVPPAAAPEAPAKAAGPSPAQVLAMALTRKHLIGDPA
ncbi:HK97 family phage prohead protease [Streptomyces sp. LS1784]|uniref:HK97 family phage prohead protease n=1 Tax=Streptomyces sp. LS1784 TaxID=2851533 RepID=UPI001CCEBA53|nr:HK97 family phage prohead protease [Streptomyces sp. LS1784]